jgi:hypothetical protein
MKVVGASYIPETIGADTSSIEVDNAWILSWAVAGPPSNRVSGNPDFVFEYRPSIRHISFTMRWAWNVPGA